MKIYFKIISRFVVLFTFFTTIIILAAFNLSAEPKWSSVPLSQDISIEKITPALHGIYFISNIGQNGGPLSYYNFLERKYSLLEDGYVKLSFDCAITHEGYLVVATGAGAITSFYYEGTWLKGYGTGAITDSGIPWANVVITGEKSYVFNYYEGTFKVSGHDYNIHEKLSWNGGNGLIKGYGGTFWSAFFSVPEYDVFQIFRVENDIRTQLISVDGVFKEFFCDSNGMIWIATGKGLYWMPSNVPLEPWNEKIGYAYPEELELCPSYKGPPPNSVVCDSLGRTLVGTQEDGLYLYDGTSWIHITKSNGIADNAITGLGVDPHNRFYAAGKDWFSSENLTPDNVVEVLPSHLVIYPPYPNPANTIINITYSIASPSKVKLDIYSLSCQKVATLFDGNVSSGIYTVKFDGSRYGSGLYFYKFSSDKFTKTGKMLLLK